MTGSLFSHCPVPDPYFFHPDCSKYIMSCYDSYTFLYANFYISKITLVGITNKPSNIRALARINIYMSFT